MRKNNIVIVNKSRFTIFLTIIIILLTFLFSGLLNRVIAKTNIFQDYQDYNEIFVREGDTIWNIAKKNNPYEEDIRKIVFKIEKLNGLEGQYIRPGDMIKIPRK
ncbi:LysM peptidoglycan-binding domain-containing protein [Clostridium sp. D2Q-14]|uniref:LysM peptidoglycan-binding domain-containing protein n=1 Tax=Anaeromonas gelatinilytica TaxID=2683194 RepID=UPI00193BA157|nr:LysM peptidoglycan-binding domain-containing protein [Anaeromonas gelatinilytica]MBS4535977.1 LysM peptidoglycan-binding domain-containing protein [Anaeromonas gelatinilytica]